MGQEKRRSPRYFFFASAELTEENSQIRVPSRVSELSLHGCYLDMMNPFPVDTVVHLTIESKDHSLHAQHRRRRNLPRRNARIPTDPKSLARTSRRPSLKIPAPLGFPTYAFFLGFIFVVADLQSLCEDSCGSGGHDFSRCRMWFPYNPVLAAGGVVC
jgi:PilZ domain